MEKPIDQETIALGKIVGIFIDSQGMGHIVPCMQACLERHWGQLGGRRGGKKTHPRDFIVAFEEGTGIGEAR